METNEKTCSTANCWVGKMDVFRNKWDEGKGQRWILPLSPPDASLSQVVAMMERLPCRQPASMLSLSSYLAQKVREQYKTLRKMKERWNWSISAPNEQKMSNGNLQERSTKEEITTWTDLQELRQMDWKVVQLMRARWILTKMKKQLVSS